ncbi:helix-turn-helix domain-containing protein [Actinomyces sp. zg-332]|uniref:helix-turn-helix domain-containing protein n=1 Tax=Actinomyces sp. zg-332 TaxID=2708340 RepID=UPI0014220F50|nr:helix-turn-helix domain-containing protein [Actinomyces sp. zg-332]QPK94038.1 helix-turn-helix domain-containing protein [Actinomyces sp. zg-332]
MNFSSKPNLYTIAEVAELMRVSKMTVYRMVHSGDLPAIRVGKSYRIPVSAIQQMLALEGIYVEDKLLAN